MTYGGVEAGGTKWVCAVGTGPVDMSDTVTFPTADPVETIARAADFFAGAGPLSAVGIGSFGPVDLRRDSPTWGHITTTPKPGWGGTDLAGGLRRILEVPVAFETDVNAAAIAEARWGAGSGLETFCYITVGTGIGGGAIVNGRLLHGLLHPEFGHMRIPHDLRSDPFRGSCPFHDDCLEGLASGEAIRRRWGLSGAVQWHDEALHLETEYLSLALMNVIAVLSPERIILGGGVMKQPRLMALIRDRVQVLAADYFDTRHLNAYIDQYLVSPTLGDHAGVLGAIELARTATPLRSARQPIA